MVTKPEITDSLARTLVLNELFDLSLYKALRDITSGDLRRMLDELIPIEIQHCTFWKKFRTDIDALGRRPRLKLRLLTLLCRLFGEPAVHLVLEAIEIYGVRKYLTLCGVRGVKEVDRYLLVPSRRSEWEIPPVKTAIP